MRINIIGCAVDAYKFVPYHDKNMGQFWVMNDNVLKDIPKIDVVIDTHDLKAVIKGKHKIRRPPDVVKACIKRIKKKGYLCYAVKEVKGIPNIKPYPYDEIVKEFDSDYFGSGPDFALALAIYKGATEIHTYGILLVCDDEYAHQKPSFEFWLGVAKGRGIKTVIHDSNNLSSILKLNRGVIYGYNKHQRIFQKYMDNPKEFVECYS